MKVKEAPLTNRTVQDGWLEPLGERADKCNGADGAGTARAIRIAVAYTRFTWPARFAGTRALKPKYHK